MHEFAIANSIRDIVLENISLHQKSLESEDSSLQVESILVQCGLLSQVVPDILHEAFNAVKLDYTSLQNAKLELELISPLVKCNLCKHEFTINDKEELFLPCPSCKQIASHSLLKGKELLVAHIELSEN